MSKGRRLETVKTYLAKYRFRHFTSKRDFRLIRGKTLQTLRRVIKDREFQELICNAGLIPAPGGYVCVAKNQRFSYCDEIEGGRSPEPNTLLTDDGERVLYRIEFDESWCVKSVQKLAVFVNSQKMDPVLFIEDVRLVAHENLILAFANVAAGGEAWPLIGVLTKDAIFLLVANCYLCSTTTEKLDAVRM